MATPLANACSIHSNCFDPSNPISNLSAENPDLPIWIGFGNFINPNNNPNLGWTFNSTGCLGICTSNISQADADLCAIAQQVICNDNGTGTDDNGGGYPSTPLFYNSAQTCTVNCPDGLPFSFTVAAGRIPAQTQALANQEAYALACRYARLDRVCLSAISPSVICVGSSASLLITASGNTIYNNLPVNSWALVSGSLPPGMSFPTGNGPSIIAITGTPTASGVFSFTVRVTSPTGDYMQKQYTVTVTDLSPSPLSPAEVNTSYSVLLTMQPAGSLPSNWQVVSGSLPPGISLDPVTGLLSGTPTQTGTFNFTIGVTI